MSLRTKILQHALPHVPEQSFTLRPLLDALSSLPAAHPDRNETVTPEVLDVLFGSELNARRELVQAWEEEGVRDMLKPEQSEHRGRSEMNMLAGILARRLEYSSRIGDHLVEASALLSSPSSSTSLPIPTRTLSMLSSFLPSIPPTYRPPHSASPSFSEPETPTRTAFFSDMLQTSNNRIPLFRANPLGPLSYGWKIADQASYAVERSRGLKKGMSDEPVGAGPEWYIGRIGLGLVYLASESHLLQPPRSSENTSSDIRLQKALRTLDTNLKRYEQVMGTMEAGENKAGDMVGYMGFIGRAWAGILRSRGW